MNARPAPRDNPATAAAPTSGEEAPAEVPIPSPDALFLSPDAVPRRKNQLLAAGLAAIAVVVLAAMVTLVMLIHDGNMPNLFALFQ